MFNKPMLYLFMLFTSIIMALNSNYWLMLWMMLELNMMSFIPLIYSTKSSSSSMIKYFIVQSAASTLLFLSLMLMMNNMNMNYIINMSMSIKLGMFPLFMWVPQMVKTMSWFSIFILLTIQKLIPMYIFSFFFSKMTVFVILLSSISSIFLMWNQTSFKSLLALSSMNHLSWMLMTFSFNNHMWLSYIMIYFLILLVLIMNMNFFNINSTFSILNTQFLSGMFILMSFWSLAGIPPLLGFLPKFMVMKSILLNFNNMIVVLVVSSLMSTFIYTRLVFPVFIYPMINKSINIKNLTLYTINFLLILLSFPLVYMY